MLCPNQIQPLTSLRPDIRDVLLQNLARRGWDSEVLEDDKDTYSALRFLHTVIDQSQRMREQIGKKGSSVTPVFILNCFPRSCDQIISIWATWFIGGIYVPIDLTINESALSDLICDLGSERIVLVGYHFLPFALENLKKDFTFETFDYSHSSIEPDLDSIASSFSQFGFNKEKEYSDNAYLLFTSGSTGRPKGVLGSHRGLLVRLLWMAGLLGLGKHDVFFHKTPRTFDVSIWEIALPFLLGSKLVVLNEHAHLNPARIYTRMLEKGVSCVHFVPSMLKFFLDFLTLRDQDFPKQIRYVVCSGEALKTQLVENFMKHIDREKVELWNLYGPTEASIDVLANRIDYDRLSSWELLGVPALETEIEISKSIDENELVIKGCLVGNGYLNGAEFVQKSSGDRVYKTGDIVSVSSLGLIYNGRLDRQVKLRGVRIDLTGLELEITESHEFVNATHCFLSTRTGNLVCVCAVSKQIDEDHPSLQRDDELEELILGSMDKTRSPDVIAFVPASQCMSRHGKYDRKLAQRLWEGI